MKRRLKSRSGIATLVFLLVIAVSIMAAIVGYYEYQRYLEKMKLLLDKEQVVAAERCARNTYLLDMLSGAITYYYDADTKMCIDASQIEGAALIKGYGRSSQKANREGETGALGIPNKGDEGGAQFLAVTIEEDGSTNMRWQGPLLTAYDYQLMTPAERERLNQSQRDQIGMELLHTET